MTRTRVVEEVLGKLSRAYACRQPRRSVSRCKGPEGMEGASRKVLMRRGKRRPLSGGCRKSRSGGCFLRAPCRQMLVNDFASGVFAPAAATRYRHAALHLGKRSGSLVHQITDLVVGYGVADADVHWMVANSFGSLRGKSKTQ